MNRQNIVPMLQLFHYFRPSRPVVLSSPRRCLLRFLPHPFLASFKFLHASPWLRRGYDLRENLRDCYFVLRVTEDCEDTELREAYLRLAKQYHPDSRSHTADSKKFAQVDTAYKTVLVRSVGPVSLNTGMKLNCNFVVTARLDTKDCPARHNQIRLSGKHISMQTCLMDNQIFLICWYLTHFFWATISNLILAQRTSGSKS
jgi:hypothetical protein